MAFDAASFKTKLSSSLGLSTTPAPVTPASKPVVATPAPATLSFNPTQTAPSPMKTSTLALPAGADTADMVKTGIKILNPLQKVKVRPAFNTAAESQDIYGGPVVGVAHDLAARTVESIPNIVLRTLSNFKAGAEIMSGKNPVPIKLPFDSSRLGFDNANGKNEVRDTGTELITKFGELEKSNPGKTKTNIALAVLAGPVTDALNAFVVGDLLTSTAKATLKASAYDPELNWALDTYGIRNSGLTGEQFYKELNRRFNAKATALVRADDHLGLDQLGQASSIIMRKLTGRGIPTLNKLGTTLENAARTGLQDAKYGFKIQDPRFPEVSPEGAVRAPGSDRLPGYMPEPGQAPAFGMSTQRVTRVGGETPETPRDGPKPFEGFKDLTTRTLDKLKGKTSVSKQYISDLTNSPDLKQPERDLIRAVLESYAGTAEGTIVDGKPTDIKISVPEFAEKVRAELLPLERSVPTDIKGRPVTENGRNETNTAHLGQQYEGISLPDELRGPVADYSEHIYQSPVKTSAGDVHFSNAGADRYFGHTRVEDLPDAKGYAEYDSGIEAYRDKDGNIIDATEAKKNSSTRRVIEVQSDLFQKGRLEGERPMGTKYNSVITPSMEADMPKVAARNAELDKLEPYKNNAAHFRMIREEVKQAALDGKTKLQFPTGETAMKVEGLGQRENHFLVEDGAEDYGARSLTSNDLKVGETIYQSDLTNFVSGGGDQDSWIITDVLGDGKFKAIPKDVYEKLEKNPDGTIKEYEDTRAEETFDISGKVDTENPIYKFYEKEVGRYLKNKYGAVRITDPQGQSWWEVPVTEEHGKNPVEAYGIGTGISEDDEDKKNKHVSYNPFMAIAGVAISKFFGPEFRGLTGLAMQDVIEASDAAIIKRVLMSVGMREGAAGIIAPKLVAADSYEKVSKTIWGEPEAKKKTSAQLPSEEESYQIMADQHYQSEPYLKVSQTEEEALTDNLTAVFKDMKDVDQETLDTKFSDEDLENARQHYEFLQDALLDHPGRALAKYVSQQTGQLPEVRGTHMFNGEEIKGNRGIWATRGDAIFQDLVGQEYSKGGDLNVAQELVDQYREMRTQLADVQKSFRSMRKTIQTQKLKDQFVDSSKRAIARELVKDVTTLKNMVQAAERAGFVKGVAAGDKKVMTIIKRIRSRRQQIVAVQKSNNLSDKQMREVTQSKDWRLVPPDEFESWLHTVNERAGVEHHKNVTKQIIGALIEESNLKNPDNLRVAMDLPAVSKMDLPQLQEYENALAQYQEGDSFIGPRMMVTLENTDLSGARTWREIKQKLAEQTGTDLSDSADVRGGEFDKYTYDQALMEKNPLYKYMVTELAAKEVENAQKLMEISHNLNKLAKAARASRGRTKIDKLVPQDKEVFNWLNTAEEDKALYVKAKRMTPQELEYAQYVQALYRGWRDVLIEKNTLKKWREAYVTHSPRSFLERWLEDSKEEGAWSGFVKSVLGSWRQFTDAHVDFPAVGDTGQVLGLEKFFKYSLPRGKEVIPSKNVARVVMQYARTFYKKDSLDQIVPKVEAYTIALQRAPGPGIPRDPTGLNVDGKLKEFIKQWLNNKKGRKLTFMVSQGGKVDTGLRIMNFVITMHDLGFNLIAQPTSAIGELMANFIAMEPGEFSLGAARLSTKEGRAVAAGYPGVVGEPPFERLINAANDASDTFMAGAYYIFQEVSYRARQQFFLGFLTPEEFKTGVVSSKRQAEIKNYMGKYRPIEGTESLIGSTTEGKILSKYKTWAVPLLNSTISDLKKAAAAFKKVPEGAQKADASKEGRRLLRLAIGGLGTYLFFSAIFQNENDKSPIGKLQKKILQELMSAYSAFDPRTWISIRAYDFTKSLVTDVTQLVTLEKYASTGVGYKKGDLKAPNSFVRDFAPAFIRQFASAETKNTTTSSSSSPSTSSKKNPALKRLDALKKAKAKSNPALDRLKKLKKQSSASNPALRRLKALKGN